MASQSNATQSYTCALTGSLITTADDPIVTPSGYICSRKLLLTKLSENGGRDPFDNERSLDESSLIELATNNNNGGVGVGVVAPPRPPNATSLPSLLSLISSEFDTTLLELYDTRKALEETRRELSSALYQNDAAVRVVARLVKERDEARGALEEFLGGGGGGSGAVAGDVVKRSEKRGRNETTTVTSTTVEQDDNGVEEGEAPSSKKARGDDTESNSDLTKIPQDTLSNMISTWTTLSKNRRLITKKSKRSSEVITKHETLLRGGSNDGQLSGNENKKVNVTKSNAKAGILCLAKVGTSCHYNNNDGEEENGSSNDEYIVSGGHDKQAIVYNVTSGQILATLRGANGDITSVSGMIVNEGRMLVVTGSADGVVRLYSIPLGGGDDDVQLLGSEQVGSGGGGEGGDVVLPVSAIVHPSSNLEDGATIIVGGSDGSVNIFKSVPSGLKKITHLKSSEGGSSSVAFSSGCLHPDGLIYAAGTTDGKVLIYDLKTQAVAGTLQGHDGNPINFITISENGYHVATSSSSSAESPIHIWDLRKLKLSATITPHEGVGTVTSLAFDPMGLYLAYSGAEATKICVVKDWDRVVGTLSKTKTGGKKNATPPSCGGVVWGGKGLDDEGGSVWVAAGCDGEKPIRFWGVE